MAPMRVDGRVPLPSFAPMMLNPSAALMPARPTNAAVLDAATVATHFGVRGRVWTEAGRRGFRWEGLVDA